MGSMFGGGDPDREDYQAINIDQDLKSRYLGIIDKYMRDKGMVDAIPQESRPYELRNPQERGEWRGATGNQINSQGQIQQPSLNNGLYFNSQPSGGARPMQNQENPRFKSALEPVQTERAVSSQVVPKTPAPPTPNQVPLATNTAFFQEDERRKQAEFNAVKDYVYRDTRR